MKGSSMKGSSIQGIPPRKRPLEKDKDTKKKQATRTGAIQKTTTTKTRDTKSLAANILKRAVKTARQPKTKKEPNLLGTLLEGARERWVEQNSRDLQENPNVRRDPLWKKHAWIQGEVRRRQAYQRYHARNDAEFEARQDMKTLYDAPELTAEELARERMEGEAHDELIRAMSAEYTQSKRSGVRDPYRVDNPAPVERNSVFSERSSVLSESMEPDARSNPDLMNAVKFLRHRETGTGFIGALRKGWSKPGHDSGEFKDHPREMRRYEILRQPLGRLEFESFDRHPNRAPTTIRTRDFSGPYEQVLMPIEQAKYGEYLKKVEARDRAFYHLHHPQQYTDGQLDETQRHYSRQLRDAIKGFKNHLKYVGNMEKVSKKTREATRKKRNSVLSEQAEEAERRELIDHHAPVARQVQQERLERQLRIMTLSKEEQGAEIQRQAAERAAERTRIAEEHRAQAEAQRRRLQERRDEENRRARQEMATQRKREQERMEDQAIRQMAERRGISDLSLARRMWGQVRSYLNPHQDNPPGAAPVASITPSAPSAQRTPEQQRARARTTTPRAPPRASDPNPIVWGPEVYEEEVERRGLDDARRRQPRSPSARQTPSSRQTPRK